MITKRFSADVTPVEGERAVMARISTAALDRDREVVLPAGMDAKDFEKNPTVFFQHQYYNLPVGKCVALTRDGEAIIAKTVFAERPASYPENLEWLPDTLLSLYQQKVMNAFSIGFEPREVRQPTKRDLEAYGEECQRVYSKWSLTEYSAVTLPANAQAVALAVSKGFKPYAESLGVKMDMPANEPEKPQQPGNYRKAESGENCGGCAMMKMAEGGALRCTKYDRECDTKHVCDDFAKMQMEPMDPQKPAMEMSKALTPKRVLYVIASEAATAPGPDAIAKEVQAQVAKRKGRIYVV